MSLRSVMGWALAGILLIAGLWGVSWYAENNGYCIMICKASQEIAEARAQAEQAIDRAERAEDRAEDAENNAEGISPWVFVIIPVVIGLIYLLDLAMRGDGQGNITMEQFVKYSKALVRRVHSLVPSSENPQEGYVSVIHVAGQVVPGSKDSWMYFVGFVRSWPPGMAYPPGYACVTVYGLSTDHERCQGVVWGKSPYDVFTDAKTGASKLQKTPTATDLAQAVERAVQEKQLGDTLQSIGGGGE